MKYIFLQIIYKLNNAKTIFSVLLILSLFLPTMYTQAASPDDLMKQGIEEATFLLEAAINQSMESAEKKIKKVISEKNLDYYLTMESYGRQNNPYKETDFLELIAAYGIAKEYSDTLETCDFYSMPFITANIEVCELENTIYGKVSLKGLDAKEILNFYKLSNNDILEKYNDRVLSYRQIVNGTGLKESVFLNISKELLTEEIETQVNEVLISDIHTSRKAVIQTAVQLVGKVPYEWGGKAVKPGYDTSWWSIRNGNQKGLDCSGFIHWSFLTAGFENNICQKLISTTEILRNTTSINENDLIPGDLGLINEGEDINHVGIYLGDDYWIHCSSNADTVVIEKTDMFEVFKSMPLSTNLVIATELINIPSEKEKELYMEQSSDNSTENIIHYNEECDYSEEDIYLLAQLIYNEANAEGMNGWIAVAEVVRNRVVSDEFPNSIRDVIYQKNPVQFSDYHLIETRKPSEEQIFVAREVLKGNLGILNNKDVLYFRNAAGSTSDWGAFKYFTSVNNHQFYTGE